MHSVVIDTRTESRNLGGITVDFQPYWPTASLSERNIPERSRAMFESMGYKTVDAGKHGMEGVPVESFTQSGAQRRRT